MPSEEDDYTISDPQAFWSKVVQPRLILTEGISSRDKTGAAVRARRALTDELSALHLAMCSLRSRCNALSPISALPAEVLVRIFQFHAAVCPPALRRLGWIKVTHICQLWRDAALQFPSLWSDISYTMGPQWAELMLSRARAAPISVHRDVAVASKRSLQHISEHLSHTRELVLVSESAILKPLIDSLPSPPGTLETLELGPTDVRFLSLSKNFGLPGAMTGRRLPALRRLALRAFWVSWSAPILCGLMHLEIQLHEPAADGYISLPHEALFRALKTMPALETLILEGCLPFGPWKDGGRDVLQLPRLKTLQLKGPSAACFGIAKRVQIPASCQVQLRGSDGADVADVLPFLTMHVRDGADLHPWHTLSIYADSDDHCFHLEMWRLSDMLEDEEDRFNPQTYADLVIWFNNPERSVAPLKAMCQTLPLRSIQTACAWIDMKVTYEDWIDLFGQCTEIEWASISGNSRTSFCDALGKTMDYKSIRDSRNCRQKHVFLGKLEVLHLAHVDFRDCRLESRDSSEYLLTGWLTDRRRVNAVPKLEIELRDCSIKEGWVDRLRMAAASVDWDHDEGECEDEYGSDEDW